MENINKQIEINNKTHAQTKLLLIASTVITIGMGIAFIATILNY